MKTVYPRPLSRPADDLPQAVQPLRAAVLYTKGQALGGEANDDLLIIKAIRGSGARGRVSRPRKPDRVEVGHLHDRRSIDWRPA